VPAIIRTCQAGGDQFGRQALAVDDHVCDDTKILTAAQVLQFDGVAVSQGSDGKLLCLAGELLFTGAVGAHLGCVCPGQPDRDAGADQVGPACNINSKCVAVIYRRDALDGGVAVVAGGRMRYRDDG
jgi:hypothetical protein